MSVHLITVQGQHKVICDTCQTFDLTQVFDGYGWQAEADQQARLDREGWRCYASRSTRHYCPSCAPRPGHRMRLVWGEER